MALKLNDKYTKNFLAENDLVGLNAQVKAAHDMLHNKTGLGNDFLGWLSLPFSYDKEEFEKIADEVIVTTVDGSYGTKGFVTNALDALDFTYVYSCGPYPMLKALAAATECSGQYSLEERMGCGFGACMGCSCKTMLGNKRICKDGPVFVKEEIIW